MTDQSPQPSLNYASPTVGDRPLRKKAVRQCRGNGIGCILLGLLIGAGTAAIASGGGTMISVSDAILLAAIAGTVAVVYFVSGILHTIASFKIRQPNPFWEKTVIITAGIHL